MDNLSFVIKTRWREFVSRFDVALIGIIVLGLILRCIGLRKGLWLDEWISFHQAIPGSILDTIEALRSDNHTPLYFGLLHFWSRLSSSEPWLRLLSVIFDALSLITIVRWLGRQSRIASLIGGALFSTLPIALRFSQEMRPYALFTLATALSFAAARAWSDSPSSPWRWFGFMGALSLATSTHLQGVFLVAPISAYFLLRIYFEKRERFNQWGRWIAACIVPGAIFLFISCVLIRHLATNTAHWWMPRLSTKLALSTASYVYLFSCHAWPAWLLVGFVLPLEFFVVMSLAFGNWRQSFPIWIASAIYITEVVIFSLGDRPIFWYRTLLPSLIPVIGAIAIQLATVRRPWQRALSIIGVVGLCAISAIGWLFTSRRPVEPFENAAAFVASNWKPHSAILFFPGYIDGTINHYFPIEPGTPNVLAYGTSSSDLNRYVSEIEKNGVKPLAIFVVVRLDLGLLDLDPLRVLVEKLRSSIEPGSELTVVLIKSHDLFFVGADQIPDRSLDLLHRVLEPSETFLPGPNLAAVRFIKK